MEIFMSAMLVFLGGLALVYIRAVVQLKKTEIKLEQEFQQHFPSEQIRLGGMARYRHYHTLMQTKQSEALLKEVEKWVRRTRVKFSLALSAVLVWFICYVWIYGIL